ncbi:MAG TPA: lysophospholipid acyltransferase family protein [Polyangiaceae bacterium]|nr:lysophospholipid acyltransferase family protein [Polyangiaceae bacterium]
MTLWHLLQAAGETARVSAPTVVEAMFGNLTPEICDERLEAWSGRLLKHARVTFTVSGLERIPPGETFVIMSNHQSLYDIPVLLQSLKRRIRFVTKTELFRVPLWGHAMRSAGMVEIDRHNRDRAIESLKNARTALAQGTNIWIAPEGTRSDTGRLGSFKKGGFHLATDAGAKILPVTISGTRHALPARGKKVTPGARVTVTVSTPIDPAEFTGAGRDPLIEAVRRAIAQHLPEERQAPAA